MKNRVCTCSTSVAYAARDKDEPLAIVRGERVSASGCPVHDPLPCVVIVMTQRHRDDSARRRLDDEAAVAAGYVY